MAAASRSQRAVGVGGRGGGVRLVALGVPTAPTSLASINQLIARASGLGLCVRGRLGHRAQACCWSPRKPLRKVPRTSSTLETVIAAGGEQKGRAV